jgi:hypothetical protein
MNYLNTTNNGGFPFVLDDLRWEADAVREALAELNAVWGDNYILSGCVITDGGATYNITAGAIVLGGEIYKVDAGSITKPGVGQDLVFVASESFDPSGLKTFESGSSFNTYVIRKAALGYDTAPTSGFNALTAETIKVKVADSVKPLLNNWVYIDMQENFSYQPQQNTNALGTGTNSLLSELGKAGSYLAYNIVAGQATINFRIIDMVVKRWDDVGAASSITLTLPSELTFDANYIQSSTFRAFAQEDDFLTGNSRVLTIPNSNTLVFNCSTPQGFGAFNREYEIQTAPSKNYTPTAATNLFSTWTLEGSVTFKLLD